NRERSSTHEDDTDARAVYDEKRENRTRWIGLESERDGEEKEEPARGGVGSEGRLDRRTSAMARHDSGGAGRVHAASRTQAGAQKEETYGQGNGGSDGGG